MSHSQSNFYDISTLQCPSGGLRGGRDSMVGRLRRTEASPWLRLRRSAMMLHELSPHRCFGGLPNELPGAQDGFRRLLSCNFSRRGGAGRVRAGCDAVHAAAAGAQVPQDVEELVSYSQCSGSRGSGCVDWSFGRVLSQRYAIDVWMDAIIHSSRPLLHSSLLSGKGTHSATTQKIRPAATSVSESIMCTCVHMRSALTSRCRG